MVAVLSMLPGMLSAKLGNVQVAQMQVCILDLEAHMRNLEVAR